MRSAKMRVAAWWLLAALGLGTGADALGAEPKPEKPGRTLQEVPTPSEAILPLPTSPLLTPGRTEQTDRASPATLSLQDVLSAVETHHPRIRSAELARGVARAKVLESLGAFDPSVGIDSFYQRYNSSSTPGKVSDLLSNGVTFRSLDPSGVSWQAGWNHNNGDVKSPASSTGTGGELFIETKIPLLRGLGINPASVALEQSELVFEQTEFNLNQLRLGILLEAGSAYYRWNATVMQWRLLEENLSLAQERAAQVAVRIEAGDLPKIDQVEADREVVLREEALVAAAREIQMSGLLLALYLWNSQGEGQDVPPPERAPGVLPERFELAPDDVERLQLEALARRPELRSLAIDRSIVTLDKDLAENQRLPQLDLTLRPGYDMGIQGIGPTIKAGLQLVIPIGTRTFDGRRQAALLKLDRIELEQVETLRRILIQVQDAGSEVKALLDRLVKAEELYRQSRQLEEAERTKFQLGDSTLFLVNIRERSALEAALRVLDLRHQLAQAHLLLEAVSGQL